MAPPDRGYEYFALTEFYEGASRGVSETKRGNQKGASSSASRCCGAPRKSEEALHVLKRLARRFLPFGRSPPNNS
jgi:hypothetical protein